MKNINLGIYIDDIEDINIIDSIRLFLETKYDIVSIHLFGDTILTKNINIAYLSSFYMSFFKGSLLFTNLENFLINKDSIISQDIFVITSLQELYNHHITKHSLETIKLLTIENGAINEI